MILISSHTGTEMDDNCYTGNQDFPTQSGKDCMNVELSELMQQMSALELLVPEESISTQKIVGEGEF